MPKKAKKKVKKVPHLSTGAVIKPRKIRVRKIKGKSPKATAPKQNIKRAVTKPELQFDNTPLITRSEGVITYHLPQIVRSKYSENQQAYNLLISKINGRLNSGLYSEDEIKKLLSVFEELQTVPQVVKKDKLKDIEDKLKSFTVDEEEVNLLNKTRKQYDGKINDYDVDIGDLIPESERKSPGYYLPSQSDIIFSYVFQMLNKGASWTDPEHYLNKKYSEIALDRFNEMYNINREQLARCILNQPYSVKLDVDFIAMGSGSEEDFQFTLGHFLDSIDIHDLDNYQFPLTFDDEYISNMFGG